MAFWDSLKNFGKALLTGRAPTPTPSVPTAPISNVVTSTVGLPTNFKPYTPQGLPGGVQLMTPQGVPGSVRPYTSQGVPGSVAPYTPEGVPGSVNLNNRLYRPSTTGGGDKKPTPKQKPQTFEDPTGQTGGYRTDQFGNTFALPGQSGQQGTGSNLFGNLSLGDGSGSILFGGQQGTSGTNPFSSGGVGSGVLNPASGVNISGTGEPEVREDKGTPTANTGIQNFLGQGVSNLAGTGQQFGTTSVANAQGNIDITELGFDQQQQLLGEAGATLDLARQYLAQNPNAPRAFQDAFAQLDNTVATARQRIEAQNPLPETPVLDEGVVAANDEELNAILNAPTEFYERAQIELGIPDDIKDLNRINNEINALVTGTDSMVSEIARLDVDVDLPRPVADAMISEIETAVELRLKALQLRAGIVNDQLSLKRDELRTRLGLVQDRSRQELSLFQDRQEQAFEQRNQAAQASREGAVIGLVQQGITDPKQIFNYMQGAMSTKDIKSILDDISDAKSEFDIRATEGGGIIELERDAQGRVIGQRTIRAPKATGGGSGSVFPKSSIFSSSDVRRLFEAGVPISTAEEIWTALIGGAGVGEVRDALVAQGKDPALLDKFDRTLKRQVGELRSRPEDQGTGSLYDSL